LEGGLSGCEIRDWKQWYVVDLLCTIELADNQGMRVILGQGTSTIFKGLYHGQVVAVKECSSDNSAKFETEVMTSFLPFFSLLFMP
jgi:hypothetical protein